MQSLAKTSYLLVQKTTNVLTTVSFAGHGNLLAQAARRICTGKEAIVDTPRIKHSGSRS
jgi:hypothetical protein